MLPEFGFCLFFMYLTGKKVIANMDKHKKLCYGKGNAAETVRSISGQEKECVWDE